MAPPAFPTHRIDVVDGSPVFVKRATDEAGCSRLRTEAVVLRALAHPATVRLVALVEEAGAVELHLAWAGSHTLATVTGVTPRAAAEIVSSLAATVADIHAVGLVHGRISADHVILGAGGRPVLAGFADAVATDRADRAEDVAALGALLSGLVAPIPDDVVLPERRWGGWWERVRSPAAWTAGPHRDRGVRAALLLLGDQAQADDPGVRPSAGELAALVRAAAGLRSGEGRDSGTALAPAPPERGREGRVQLRRHEEAPAAAAPPRLEPHPDGRPGPGVREARPFTLGAVPVEAPPAATRPAAPAIRLLGGVAWVVVLVSSALLLHALGSGLLASPPILDRAALSRWLADRDALVVAFALVRVVGLGLSLYLLAVTLLGLLARVSRVPALVAAADVATIPPVRQVLAALAGVSLTASAASLVATHALAPRAAPVVTPLDEEVAPPASEPAPTEPREAPDELPSPREEPFSTRAEPDPEALAATTAEGESGPGSPMEQWTVAPGDHLWAVAETALARAWGRTPSDAEVDPYWRVVVETNRVHLLDPANPDLVRPGQVLIVPAPPPVPRPGAR